MYINCTGCTSESFRIDWYQEGKSKTKQRTTIIGSLSLQSVTVYLNDRVFQSVPTPTNAKIVEHKRKSFPRDPDIDETSSSIKSLENAFSEAERAYQWHIAL